MGLSWFIRLGLSLFLVFLPFLAFAQHPATRDDGRKVILHDDFTWSFADGGKPIPKGKIHVQPRQLEIPALLPGEEIVSHSAYSLVYAEKYEQAKWVAYPLTAAHTQKEFERTDHFVPDPKIATGSATDADYKGSGFDRGHLAPASDMGWSETAMAESFYYSNMSPQVPTFNRGIWKQGEDLVRQWARAYGSLYVVVGPVLKAGLATIGPNKVAVPEHYFKVILDKEGPEAKALAFIIPNKGSTEPLQSFVVSVDSVEKVTGIDFFPNLPDEEEMELEHQVCLSCWKWPTTGPTRNTGKGGNLTLCKGKNKDGSPCTNHILRSKTHCSTHNP